MLIILHYTNTVMIPQHTGNRILVQVMVFPEKQERFISDTR